MAEGTQEDWDRIGTRPRADAPEPARRRLRRFPVDRLTHSCRRRRAPSAPTATTSTSCARCCTTSATRWRPYNHPSIAAGDRQAVRLEGNHWMVEHHGIFQGYYFWHHLGRPQHPRRVRRLAALRATARSSARCTTRPRSTRRTRRCRSTTSSRCCARCSRSRSSRSTGATEPPPTSTPERNALRETAAWSAPTAHRRPHRRHPPRLRASQDRGALARAEGADDHRCPGGAVAARTTAASSACAWTSTAR